MANSDLKSSYIPPKDGKKWKAYCVIDVGSVTCGYAYSFEDIKEVWLNTKWADASQGSYRLRAPSAVLYDQNGQPKYFGFQAIDTFLAMNRKDCRFTYNGILEPKKNVTFPTDKSDIISDDEDSDMETSGAVEGHIRQGHTIAEHDNILHDTADLAVLLTKHCITEIKNNYKAYRPNGPDEINLGVLVPYTWPIRKKTRFRRLMKRHIAQAFGTSIKFDLVSTTEALWQSIKDQPYYSLPEHIKKTKQKGVILIHAGGTMIETSLHLKDSSGLLTDIVQQDIGGTDINKVFMDYFKQAIAIGTHRGDDFINNKAHYLSSWLEFMRQFEVSKKAVRYREARPLEMYITYGFAEAFRNITGKDLKQGLNNSNITMTNAGKMQVPYDIIQDTFINVTTKLEKNIKDLLLKHSDVTITAIVLTGGFARSDFLHEYIQDMLARDSNISHIPVIIPDMTSMMVVKGAVLKSKMTSNFSKAYGIAFWDYHVEDNKMIHRMEPVINVGDIKKIGKTYTCRPVVMSCVYKEKFKVDLFEINKKIDMSKDSSSFYIMDSFMEKSSCLENIPVDISGNCYKKICRLLFQLSWDSCGKLSTSVKLMAPELN